jgi:MFS family permease
VTDRTLSTRDFVVRVLSAYAICRFFSVVLLAIVARYQAPVDWTGPRPDYFSMTVLWDGFWYRQVAEAGYPAVLPVDAVTGAVQQNAWAFYPAFPMMARPLMRVTGLGFPIVGSTLALLLGFGAAVMMALLFRDRVGPKVALAAVAVYAASPVSPSFQIAYTESLGILVLCAFLWALSKERWILAAGLAVLIGVTRAMALPLVVVALVALFLRWRRRHTDPITAREGLSALAMLGCCGVAGLLWPVIVSVLVGSTTAYADTMGAWSVGGSVQLLRPWLEFVREPANALKVALGLVLILVMTLGPWAARLGPELRTWTLAYTGYLILVDAPSTSLFRHLLPLFPLALVLVGGAWQNRPARWFEWRTGFFILIGLAGQIWWVWALLRFVPPIDFPP